MDVSKERLERMSTPIEASSVSSLTNLLASPPQYPRNPTHQPNEPLVLYIVRVPGSKDVFLTPLKPPTKASISLEAIQSSFYYLHVETAEDEEVRESLEAERLKAEQQTPVTPISRKPLPPTPFANYPASQRPHTPPKSYPNYQPPGEGSNVDTQAARFSARGGHLRFRAESDVVHRRPLGPRLLPSQGRSTDVTSPRGPSPPRPTPEEIDSRRWSVPDRHPSTWVAPLKIPQNGSSATERQSPSSPLKQLANETNMLSSGSEQVPTSITIIRRDPTSGAQWNVGSIQVTGRTHNLSLLQPVEVTLTSPGYTKLSQSQATPSEVTDGALSDFPPFATSSKPTFYRRVGFRMLSEDQKPSLHHVRTNANEALDDITNSKTPKLRNVYAFTSPWNGICAFSNGVDGRSLKCRHTLPSQPPSDSGAPLAELRFNLPWSILKPKDLNKHHGTEADKLPINQLLRSGKTPKEQWRRSVQSFKSIHHRNWHGKATSSGAEETDVQEDQRTSEESLRADDEDSYRLSLKLGREKAGGGFKGSSAKLGKLIIYDEGLKMGDLVVASNMGVWWQHYQEGI